MRQPCALFSLRFFFQVLQMSLDTPIRFEKRQLNHAVTRIISCRETLLYFPYSRKRVCKHRYVRKVYDQNM